MEGRKNGVKQSNSLNINSLEGKKRGPPIIYIGHVFFFPPPKRTNNNGLSAVLRSKNHFHPLAIENQPTPSVENTDPTAYY